MKYKYNKYNKNNKNKRIRNKNNKTNTWNNTMLSKSKLPFSKATINAARYESYIVAFLLFVFVWFDKDVSAIAILASLSWGGYRAVQSFYLWLAKHEHILDKKIEYMKNNINTERLDSEIDLLEEQQFDNDY